MRTQPPVLCEAFIQGEFLDPWILGFQDLVDFFPRPSETLEAFPCSLRRHDDDGRVRTSRYGWVIGNGSGLRSSTIRPRAMTWKYWVQGCSRVPRKYILASRLPARSRLHATTVPHISSIFNVHIPPLSRRANPPVGQTEVAASVEIQSDSQSCS
jgi:hypothetical protein